MSACGICANSAGHETYSVREMHSGTKEEFEYFLCSHYGCLQIANPPENMSKYYSGNYYSFISDPDNEQNESSFRSRIFEWAAVERNRYELLRKPGLGFILEKIKPKPLSLFELSLWNIHGFFNFRCWLRVRDIPSSSPEMGMKNLLGIDPYISDDVTYANGLKIIKTDLAGLKNEWNNAFDVIMFNHSFEHLPNPFEVLLAARDRLKANGVVLIRIPTVSSYAWQHYKTDWVQIDAPRYYYIYSVESLRILAEKARFEITNIIDDSTAFQFWGSEQYRQNISLSDDRSYSKNPQESIFSPADLSRFENLAKTLNKKRMGDQAAFYLRKL